jgi:hypothetical protein
VGALASSVENIQAARVCPAAREAATYRPLVSLGTRRTMEEKSAESRGSGGGVMSGKWEKKRPVNLSIHGPFRRGLCADKS